MKENQIAKEPDCTAGGFLFYNEKDARLAETELKKIEYIEARMNYDKPDKILQIYEKAVRDRIFTTPAGIFYLKGIQEFLLEQPDMDESSISPIPLFHTYDRELRQQQKPVKSRVNPKASNPKKSPAFPISVILNILLGIAVIAMFVITLQSDNPNVMNYERVLTNRYASWEQQLTEREQTVREKERELQIESQ